MQVYIVAILMTEFMIIRKKYPLFPGERNYFDL